jgi:metal-sulfur cluster biosynthetic enzyme
MTVEATDALAGQVRDPLRLVIDPELGDNIVELGLVYYVAVKEGGVAHIVMTTTTRGCPATAYLKDGARESAWTVPGIEFVDVALTYEPTAMDAGDDDGRRAAAAGDCRQRRAVSCRTDRRNRATPGQSGGGSLNWKASDWSDAL